MPNCLGFKSVIIEPHPGSLKWVKAGLPHYLGEIEADLQFDKNGKVKGTIVLPEGLKGIFVWDKQTVDIVGGVNKVALGPINAKYISE